MCQDKKIKTPLRRPSDGNTKELAKNISKTKELPNSEAQMSSLSKLIGSESFTNLHRPPTKSHWNWPAFPVGLEPLPSTIARAKTSEAAGVEASQGLKQLRVVRLPRHLDERPPKPGIKQCPARNSSKSRSIHERQTLHKRYNYHTAVFPKVEPFLLQGFKHLPNPGETGFSPPRASSKASLRHW